MNIPPDHTRLLRQATAALSTLLGQPVSWEVEFGSGGVSLRLASWAIPVRVVPHLPTVLSPAAPGLLLTSYVSPTQARTLRQRQQAYLDTAGNAYWRAWGRGGEIIGLLDVSGKPKSQAFQISLPSHSLAELQLLFHLLSKPALLNAPYRCIAEQTRVSLGSITNTFQTWQAHDQLHIARGKFRQWAQPAAMLAHWMRGYSEALRPAGGGGQRYSWSEHPGARWVTSRRYSLNCFWSGEPAAQLLLRYHREYVPTSFSAHCPTPPAEWGLIPDPQHGCVELLPRPFAHVPITGGIAPPLLVYSDLLLSPFTLTRAVAPDMLEKFLPHLSK